MIDKLNRDNFFMQHALNLAAEGARLGEVPVGAVVVMDDVIIGEGYNRPISSADPSAHAEVVALRDAATRLGNYRLPKATLYVSLEPCTMCTGMIVHARIERLVYATTEPKAGVIESQAKMLSARYFNHTVTSLGGVMADESRQLLQEFFRQRRLDQRGLEKTR